VERPVVVTVLLLVQLPSLQHTVLAAVAVPQFLVVFPLALENKAL
jgi:hypothetical protein